MNRDSSAEAIARWVVPSLGSVIALGALVNALFLRRHLLFAGDGDVGRHIRVGRTILETEAIPRVDLFSHTRAGTPFVPYEWLSETITALVDHAAGLAGVAALSALLYMVAVFAIYRTSILLGVPRWLAAPGAILGLVLQSVHLLPRPHLFTTALAGLYMIVLVRFAVSGRSWHLAPLPILMLAWANLHGGFLVGFILIAAFLAGALLRSEEFREARAAVRPLLVTLGLCALASLVNPAGIGLWGHVTGYLGIDFLVDITQEYQSVDFHQDYGRLFLVALLAGPALWMTGRVKVSWLGAGLYIFFAAAALHSARNIPLFTVAVLPWLGVWSREFLRAGGQRGSLWLTRLNRLGSIDEQLRPGVATVAGLLAIAVVLGPEAEAYRFDQDRFPVRALAELGDATPDGPVFNDLAWGGYLLYARPDIPVFIDGQTDFYGENLSREYVTVIHGRPGWDRLLREHGVTWTLTSRDDPLNQLLALRDDWEEIYADELVRVFRRLGPRAARS